MKARLTSWSLLILPLACFVLMGGDCDSSGTDTASGIISIIVGVAQLVFLILSVF